MHGQDRRRRRNGLVRTHCAGFHPCFSERACFLLAAGSRLAAKAGRPSPANQRVGADVMHQLLQRATTVALGIFDLGADLTERLAFPPHLTRREVPFRVARHAGGIEVGLLVADRATHGRQPMTIGAALHRRLMEAACSPWRGRSPAGWQFTQRGFVNTFPSSTNIAADRAAGSAIEAKLSGVARLSDWSETASAIGAPVSRATSATRTLIRISSPITTSPASRGGGQSSRWSRPEMRSSPREITSWIGQNHGAHGLVIFDVAGAAAQVPVERLGNGLFEFGPRHRISLQTLEQHLAFVQKTRGTVAALEGKMRDKLLLQKRQFAVPRMAFHGADRLAVEVHRRNDAGGAGVARPVGIIDDHRAAQALRDAAAELGTGHPEILAQEIVHRQFVAHLARTVSATIDRDDQHRRLRTPLIMAWVTGKDRKR